MEAGIKQREKWYIEIIILIMLYMIMDIQGIYKYIVVSLVSVVFLLYNRKHLKNILQDAYIFIPIIVYCGIGVCLSIFAGNINIWTIKTIIFWSLPPIFSLCIGFFYRNEKREYLIDAQFWASTGAYLLTKLGYILINGKFESPFAFVFGLFMLYYAYRNQWKYLVLAGMMMYLANKRIVLLAVVVCLLIVLFMRIVKHRRCWINIIWTSFIALSSVYIYSIFNGSFFSLCYKIGIDTSHRIEVYPKIVEQIPGRYLWGEGLGTTNVMLSKVLDAWMYSWFENPHNDFLKIYVDLGAVGFVTFFLSFFCVFYIAWRKGVKKQAISQLLVIIMYFMVLMTTDNVSIYILFLVPMHSICLALVGEKG